VRGVDFGVEPIANFNNTEHFDLAIVVRQFVQSIVQTLAERL
jgi:hypothetical protein